MSHLIYCMSKSLKNYNLPLLTMGKTRYSFACFFFFFPPYSLQMSAGLWTQCVTTLNETQQKAIQDLLNTAWARSPVVSPLFRNTPIKTSWTFGSLPSSSGRWPPTLLSNSIYIQPEQRSRLLTSDGRTSKTPTKNYFFSPHGSGMKSLTSPPWLAEERVFKLDVNHYLCV